VNAPGKPTVVFLIGCTASGKGALGRELAERLGAEILSVDSMKVYRRMDIGTAKATVEQRRRVPHHLIDVVEPSESFSAARFSELAEQAVEQVHGRGRIALGVGGTVLYLKTLTEGIFEGPASDAQLREQLRSTAQAEGPQALHRQLQQVDPLAAERIHPNDLRRIVRALEVYHLTGRPISDFQRQFGQLRSDWKMAFVGIRHSRQQGNARINARVKRMIDLGLVDEVRSLLREQPPMSLQARQALGYAEIIAHLQGLYDLSEAVERIKINTRRFAKSQRTWFRQLRHVHWFDVADDADPLSLVEPMLDWIDRRMREAPS